MSQYNIFYRVVTIFEDFSEMTWFPNNSSYSFFILNEIEKKIGGELDYQVAQRIMFRYCSTPSRHSKEHVLSKRILAKRLQSRFFTS